MRDTGGTQPEKGFTLIELMIVVAIIAILAAIAMPSLLGARKSADEAATVGALRTICNAEEMYRTHNGAFGTIAELSAGRYIDETFNLPSRRGYVFTDAAAPDATGYQITAAPSTPGTSGDRFYFLDESGVIRFMEGAAADASSSPVD